MGYKNTELLTPAEAAKKLKITKWGIYGIIRSGDLKAIDVSNGSKKPRYEIREDELEEFMKGYKKNKVRNKEVEEIKPKEKPKARLREKSETKAEISRLKEDLLNILVRLEDLESKI